MNISEIGGITVAKSNLVEIPNNQFLGYNCLMITIILFLL